jgi:hypothetical protein
LAPHRLGADGGAGVGCVDHFGGADDDADVVDVLFVGAEEDEIAGLERLVGGDVWAGVELFLGGSGSADDGSVFVRALESPRVQRAVESLPGGSTPFHVEAMQYQWWEERRVIAVATPAPGSDGG